MKITLSKWAEKVGVSRNRAREWATSKPPRIKAENPTFGVWLIDENEPRPKPLRPWHHARVERIERENL